MEIQESLFKFVFSFNDIMKLEHLQFQLHL